MSLKNKCLILEGEGEDQDLCGNPACFYFPITFTYKSKLHPSGEKTRSIVVGVCKYHEDQLTEGVENGTV